VEAPQKVAWRKRGAVAEVAVVVVEPKMVVARQA
jgi:hypothetical protein